MISGPWSLSWMHPSQVVQDPAQFQLEAVDFSECFARAAELAAGVRASEGDEGDRPRARAPRVQPPEREAAYRQPPAQPTTKERD